MIAYLVRNGRVLTAPLRLVGAARRRGGIRGPDARFLISTAPSVSCQINARQSDQKWFIPWDVVEMVRVVATGRGN
jgi:hypothetical protein